MATLQLTDGSTTLDLLDQTNYAVLSDGWNLSMAPTASLSSNYYDLVVETLTIDVRGSTAAVMYSNMTALLKLLQQAERWAAQTTSESAVRLRYQPTNSTLSAPLECLCMGRAGSDQDVTLNVYDDGGLTKVNTVTIKMLRRALWLKATADNATITGGNLSTWNVWTATLPASPTYGPVSTSLALTNGPWTTFGGSQYLAIAATGDITILSASSLADASQFTSITSTAFPSVGTTVLKFTEPASNTVQGPSSKTISVPTPAPTNVYDVFLSGRADTTPMTFWIMPTSQAGASAPDTTKALLTFTMTASATVSSMYVGRIILPGTASTYTLGIAMQGTNPNVALIDRIAFVRQAADTAIVQTTISTNGVPGSLSVAVTYAMNPLSALTPSNALSSMTGTTAMLSRATSLSVLWMANDTSSTGGYTLTASTTSGGAKSKGTWTLTQTRNQAYLVPE